MRERERWREGDRERERERKREREREMEREGGKERERGREREGECMRVVCMYIAFYLSFVVPCFDYCCAVPPVSLSFEKKKNPGTCHCNGCSWGRV